MLEMQSLGHLFVPLRRKMIDLETISQDLKALIPALSKIGLLLNSSKCELTLSPSTNAKSLNSIKETLPNMKITELENLTLLNSPIMPESIDEATEKSRNIVSTMCQRISTLDAHTGLFFLTHHTSF